jgi:flagellar biosynthesis protein FliQ
MDLLDSSSIQQVLRVVWLAAVPLLFVPVVGFAVSLVQGMMGTREGSVAYSARVLAAAGAVIFFGAAVWQGFQELLRQVLQ